MKIKIHIGRAFGKVAAPPSKSMAHRLIIAAAFADGVSEIYKISDCEDVKATLGCLSALGIKTELQGDTLRVYGKSPFDLMPNGELFANESGSTLRFLIPPALLSGNRVTFTGKESLMKRPMEIYEDIFSEKSIEYVKDGSSITVCGTLPSGSYTVRGDVSSQFISGLLFALSAIKDDSTIQILPPIESRSYIDMTLDALGIFGKKAEWTDEFNIKIYGDTVYTPTNITVEGDYSGAAFTESFNELGGDVTVTGLNGKSLQGDAVYKSLFKLLSEGTPTIKIGDCPDLAPILFTLAAYKNGAIFEETKRLAVKESNRALAMKEELEKFGADIEVSENRVTVRKSELHKPNEPLSGHNDHRIVMSLAVLATKFGAEIDGAEAVSKSYPDFFYDINSLGIVTEEI